MCVCVCPLLIPHSLIYLLPSLLPLPPSLQTDCSVFCNDTDGVDGHYTCDENGNKQCLNGYQNSSTNCTECIPAFGCCKKMHAPACPVWACVMSKVMSECRIVKHYWCIFTIVDTEYFLFLQLQLVGSVVYQETALVYQDTLEKNALKVSHNTSR